jgi:hypothetical protein
MASWVFMVSPTGWADDLRESVKSKRVKITTKVG